MNRLPHGPLMIDIAGTELSELDRQRLADPRVGGVILFSRNYTAPDQLTRLCTAIHALRDAPLLIAVDHEGGRVQRFRDGFTRLPAMRLLGERWDADRQAARAAARDVGLVLATELLRCGVDFSFTPVLDLDWERSAVIGNRAFHRDPLAVVELAAELIAGLRKAGMACCGKHFPGHGWVEADSHVAIPVDERTADELAADLLPYRHLQLDAVMPAHVIYRQIDSRPAGFSPYWIKRLRAEFSFEGVVFSDDLSMEGAAVAGDIVERAQAAWAAGCDMLPVCNAPASVAALLDRWHPPADARRSARIARLMPQPAAKSERYRMACESLPQLASG